MEKAGFNFEILVEKWLNKADKRPSHEDMLNDLKQKREIDPLSYRRLREAMLRVYNRKETDEYLKIIGI